MKPGIHLVHKRVGESSFDVVRAFMKEIQALGLPRKYPVGHGGTLDPFAEGLLLILTGQATRLMELLHAVPKTYVAQVIWGAETDNGDPTGQVIATGSTDALSPEALDAALVPFLGWTEQTPPATSAKKIGGESAYKKARRGEVFELKPVRVYLHRARWLAHDLPRSSQLELTCRGGFYVRALARDVGRLLGARAHLSTLLRTEIGPWRDPGPGQRLGIHGEQLLPWCPARELTDAEVGELEQGRPIPLGELQPPSWKLPDGFPDPEGPVRGTFRGKLVALMRPREAQLAVFANFRAGI